MATSNKEILSLTLKCNSVSRNVENGDANFRGNENVDANVSLNIRGGAHEQLNQLDPGTDYKIVVKEA